MISKKKEMGFRLREHDTVFAVLLTLKKHCHTREGGCPICSFAFHGMVRVQVEP